MRARLHQREQRHDLRRVARRAADRTCAALQCRHPLGQRRDGGVRQARIDVAHFLQVEELGRMVRIAEDESGRLIDRHLPRARGGVGPVARMHLKRVEAEGFCHEILPEDAGTLGASAAAHNGGGRWAGWPAAIEMQRFVDRCWCRRLRSPRILRRDQRFPGSPTGTPSARRFRARLSASKLVRKLSGSTKRASSPRNVSSWTSRVA